MSLVLFITENKNAVVVLDELLKDHLTDIDVILAPNSAAAINSVDNKQRLSAIVIDQEAEKSLENIKILKSKNIDSPIIAIVENKEAMQEKFESAGASETIEKPFFFKDFEPFLHSLVSEYEACDKGCFSIHDIDFFPANRVLYRPCDNNSVNLTEKENEILKYMYQRRGNFIDKDTLLKEVWSYNSQDISTHTLETHIYRLRGKLEKLTDKEIIITESGSYKLN